MFIEVLNQNQAHSRCDTHNFAMKDTAQKSVTHFDVNFNLPKQRLGQCRHTTAEFIDTQLCIFNLTLTLILLTWTIWRAPTNASKWRMGFN